MKWVKKNFHKKLILTPHLGEMSRLINKPVNEIAENLIYYAKELNYRYGAMRF